MIIATSDLHFHKYKRFNQNGERLRVLEEFLVYLFQLADKNGVRFITFSGDLFNNMQVVHIEALTRVVNIFYQLHNTFPDVVFIAISGNHDQATRNTIDNPATSTLEALDGLPNFKLIDDNTYGDETGEICFYGVPYYSNPEDFGTALDKMVDRVHQTDYKTDILLMHQTMGLDLVMVEEDVSPLDERFDNFMWVLNGHIHGHKNFGKGIFNVGSPVHRDAGDIGVAKGILAIDTDSDTTQFMDLSENYPQFIRKEIGSELTEWEQEQYVLWVPKKAEDTEEESIIKEKFDHTKNSRKDLLTNYMEVASEKVPDALKQEVKSYQSKVLQYADKV